MRKAEIQIHLDIFFSPKEPERNRIKERINQLAKEASEKNISVVRN